MTDPLRQLLIDADVAPATSIDHASLTRSVRRRHRRRQRVVRITGAAATAMLMIAVALLLSPSHRSTPPQVVTAPPPAVAMTSPQQLAALDLDARLHELTAEKLVAMSKRPAEAAAASPPRAPAADIQLQRDRAALLIVYEADQNAQSKRTTLAAAGYRRAIELFPQTHWAEVARQRLKELQT